MNILCDFVLEGEDRNPYSLKKTSLLMKLCLSVHKYFWEFFCDNYDTDFLLLHLTHSKLVIPLYQAKKGYFLSQKQGSGHTPVCKYLFNQLLKLTCWRWRSFWSSTNTFISCDIEVEQVTFLVGSILRIFQIRQISDRKKN